jgi:hypothetical protein
LTQLLALPQLDGHYFYSFVVTVVATTSLDGYCCIVVVTKTVVAALDMLPFGFCCCWCCWVVNDDSSSGAIESSAPNLHINDAFVPQTQRPQIMSLLNQPQNVHARL